jgi:hypothetical protein
LLPPPLPARKQRGERTSSISNGSGVSFNNFGSCPSTPNSPLTPLSGGGQLSSSGLHFIFPDLPGARGQVNHGPSRLLCSDQRVPLSYLHHSPHPDPAVCSPLFSPWSSGTESGLSDSDCTPSTPLTPLGGKQHSLHFVFPEPYPVLPNISPDLSCKVYSDRFVLNSIVVVVFLNCRNFCGIKATCFWLFEQDLRFSFFS